MNPLFAPRALPLTKQWYKQNTRVICSFCSLLESSRQIRQNRSSKAWNPWTNAMMMMIFSRRSFSPFPIFHGNNVLEPPIFGRSSRLSSGYLTGIRTHSVHKILLTSLDKRRPSAAVISPNSDFVTLLHGQSELSIKYGKSGFLLFRFCVKVEQCWEMCNKEVL